MRCFCFVCKEFCFSKRTWLHFFLLHVRLPPRWDKHWTSFVLNAASASTSQVPTEWERSPGLWRRAPVRAWSWGVTCPLPWTASSPPMWWSGSSLECRFPSLSTSASTLLMWIQSTLVRCLSSFRPGAICFTFPHINGDIVRSLSNWSSLTLLLP